jgi:hypothetical protein
MRIRSAAQLVVDAPSLVTLGPDDVQAAGLDDLVVLRLRLIRELLEEALVFLPRHAVETLEVEKVDELLVVDVLLLALGQALGDGVGQRLLARHVLRVAAEQDVRAAARHVRGDGHVGHAPGLRDDLGFLRVELGVQHDVLDAAPLEHAGELFGLLNRHRADERRPA